jgi:hypothetical protein
MSDICFERYVGIDDTIELRFMFSALNVSDAMPLIGTLDNLPKLEDTGAVLTVL